MQNNIFCVTKCRKGGGNVAAEPVLQPERSLTGSHAGAGKSGTVCPELPEREKREENEKEKIVFRSAGGCGSSYLHVCGGLCRRGAEYVFYGCERYRLIL